MWFCYTLKKKNTLTISPFVWQEKKKYEQTEEEEEEEEEDNLCKIGLDLERERTDYGSELVCWFFNIGATNDGT